MFSFPPVRLSRPMTVRPLILVSGLLLTLVPSVHAATSNEAALAEAWQQTALNLFNDANLSFAELSGREARFGEAVTLLQVQPKTNANVDRAVALFGEVLAENAGDKLGITARYYLGRIEQLHRSPINPEAAAGHFRQLVQEYPAHPMAEQALVKLALIELYGNATDVERQAAFERLAGSVATLKTADAIRDLNLILAEAGLRFGQSPAMALDHYIAAEQAGIHLTTVRGSVLVAIGELARQVGRVDVARRYYELFLQDFQRDTRRRLIRERLAALPAVTSTNSVAEDRS